MDFTIPRRTLPRAKTPTIGTPNAKPWIYRNPPKPYLALVNPTIYDRFRLRLVCGPGHLMRADLVVRQSSAACVENVGSESLDRTMRVSCLCSGFRNANKSLKSPSCNIGLGVILVRLGYPISQATVSPKTHTPQEALNFMPSGP